MCLVSALLFRVLAVTWELALNHYKSVKLLSPQVPVCSFLNYEGESVMSWKLTYNVRLHSRPCQRTLYLFVALLPLVSSFPLYLVRKLINQGLSPAFQLHLVCFKSVPGGIGLLFLMSHSSLENLTFFLSEFFYQYWNISILEYFKPLKEKKVKIGLLGCRMSLKLIHSFLQHSEHTLYLQVSKCLYKVIPTMKHVYVNHFTAPSITNSNVYHNV